MALAVTVESVASAARDVAIASLHQLLGDRFVNRRTGARATWQGCLLSSLCTAGRRRIHAIDRGGERDRQDMCATQSADYPFWEWHRLGRPCRGVAGRGVYRYLADEPDPAGPHWGSGCHGTSRR